MCGIAGIQWKRHKKADKATRQVFASLLAIGNASRGTDSWGIRVFDSQNPNKEVVQRGMGTIAQVPAKMLAKYDSLMLHTRWATTGSKTIKNAHPFRFGNILGMHNGIIYNHQSLNTKYSRNHEVDSMHIFDHLSQGLGLEELTGYGSITWVDYSNDPRRIYFCKLQRGDLSVFRMGKNTDLGVVFSSDDDHIHLAAKAAGIHLRAVEIKEGNIYYIEDGEVYDSERTLKLGEGYTYTSWSNGFGSGSSSTNFDRWGHHYNEYVDDDEADLARYFEKKEREEMEAFAKQHAATQQELEELFGDRIEENGEEVDEDYLDEEFIINPEDRIIDHLDGENREEFEQSLEAINNFNSKKVSNE